MKYGKILAKEIAILINKNNLGIAKEFNSDKQYAEAILELVSLDQKSLFEGEGLTLVIDTNGSAVKCIKLKDAK